MCELLGMNCNVPTDIRFSFSGLIERGGRTGPHSDGWGIAFYERRGCRTFHDPRPGCQSEVADLIRGYSIKSLNVICHIRKATHGRVCLENTHPFTRELWGRHWAFAHNGKLKGVKSWPLDHYRPIGTTDSEHAFCWMLDQVRARYPVPPRRPGGLRRLIGALAARLGEQGVFNMLLCDSRHLYCYCATELTWLTRRAPFGEASLIDTELTVDFAKETTPRDIVTVIATRPLTDHEPWRTMAPGGLVVFKDGLPLPG
ncbi:MAG: class II glutamine amidotransferase [Rhodospirillales bacterium]|nr:class II glutamine amidotransferase [Rhodospirillales bacterium]